MPPVRGCTGKKAYGTFAQAERSARRMRQQHEDGCRVEPYRCRHCGDYHVGTRWDLRGDTRRIKDERDEEKIG